MSLEKQKEELLKKLTTEADKYNKEERSRFYEIVLEELQKALT